MAQVSRRTRIIRRVLIIVLVASVGVAAVAIKNKLTQETAPVLESSVMIPPEPTSAPGAAILPEDSREGAPNADDTLSSPKNMGGMPASPSNTVPQSGGYANAGDGKQDSLALIISLITSVTSVLGLLMSKYTEWQRARLEQMKLAIELQQKELELQEMRRKLQNV